MHLAGDRVDAGEGRLDPGGVGRGSAVPGPRPGRPSIRRRGGSSRSSPCSWPGLLERGEDLRTAAPIESTVWRTSAIVWLMSFRSTGPSPTCSMIGSKNVVSTPVIDLAGGQRHGRPARRDDVDVAHARQRGLDRDLDVLPELLDQVGRQRDPHPARSVPSTLLSTMSRSTTCRRRARRPAPGCRRGGPGRRGRRRRSSAAAPGSRVRRRPGRPGRSGRPGRPARSARPRSRGR